MKKKICLAVLPVLLFLLPLACNKAVMPTDPVVSTTVAATPTSVVTHRRMSAPNPGTSINAFGCFAQTGDGGDMMTGGSPAPVVSNSPWSSPCGLVWISDDPNGFTPPAIPSSFTLTRSFTLDPSVINGGIFTLTFQADDEVSFSLNGNEVASCSPPPSNTGACQQTCQTATIQPSAFLPSPQLNNLTITVTNLGNISTGPNTTGYSGVAYNLCVAQANATPSVTPSVSATPRVSPTPTPVITNTPQPTATSIETPVATDTPTPTATFTPVSKCPTPDLDTCIQCIDAAQAASDKAYRDFLEAEANILDVCGGKCFEDINLDAKNLINNFNFEDLAGLAKDAAFEQFICFSVCSTGAKYADLANYVIANNNIDTTQNLCEQRNNCNCSAFNF